jgi:hypothetical protein
MAAILDLNTMDDSFIFAGIHPATGYRWLKAGRTAQRGEMREFYEVVERTKTQAKMLLVKKVTAAARTDPKMALEVLNRRYPEEWARRNKVELEDKTPGATKREGVRDRVVAAIDRVAERLGGTAIAAAEETVEDTPE